MAGLELIIDEDSALTLSTVDMFSDVDGDDLCNDDDNDDDKVMMIDDEIVVDDAS